MPIVLAGAKLVAEQVLDGLDMEARIPWVRSGQQKQQLKGENKNSALDRAHGGVGLGWLVVLLVAIMAVLVAAGGAGGVAKK